MEIIVNLKEQSMNDWPIDIFKLYQMATELLDDIESCDTRDYREAINFAFNHSFEAASYHFNEAITQFNVQILFDKKYSQIKRHTKDVLCY